MPILDEDLDIATELFETNVLGGPVVVTQSLARLLRQAKGTHQERRLLAKATCRL